MANILNLRSILFILIITMFTIDKISSRKLVNQCAKSVCYPDAVLPVYDKTNENKFYAFKDNKLWLFKLNDNLTLNLIETYKIQKKFNYYPKDGKINTAFAINDKYYYLINNKTYYRYDIKLNNDYVYQGNVKIFNQSNHIYVNAINIDHDKHRYNVNIVSNNVLFKDEIDNYYLCKFIFNNVFDKENINCKPVKYDMKLSKYLRTYRTYTYLKDGKFIGFTNQTIIIKDEFNIDENMHLIDETNNHTLCTYDYFCKSYDFIPIDDDLINENYGKVVKFNSSPYWVIIFILITVILITILFKIVIDLLKENPRLPIIRRTYKRLPVDRHPFIIS